MITRLDFIGIPSQDADRARSFYRDTLGLRPYEHGAYEQWAGDTCFGIWEPKKVGMPFVAQKGNPWALGCDDVAATRAELEAKGVEFAGDTLDTGVCHMAFSWGSGGDRR
jgi:catechol 2,3-dioxygenase-like lactoylglutathione lyase family enzyme